MPDRDLDHTTVIDLHGELDVGREQEIVDRIAAIDAGVTRIVVDLSDVELLDAHTIGVLLSAQQTAAGRGVRLHIQHVHGLARRVLEVTGVLETLCDPTAQPGHLPPRLLRDPVATQSRKRTAHRRQPT